MKYHHLLTVLFLLASLHAHGASSDAEADGDWAQVLGEQLEILQQQPANTNARKTAWRAAMHLGLFTQAAALKSALSRDEQRAMDGDRMAQEIRYGIIDRNTLRGEQRFNRLDQALAASDALAASFFAGQIPDAEDQRCLTDRLSGLAARRRALDAIQLYAALIERQIAVPLWARRDVAGSYLELRQPQMAVTLYQEVVAATPDDFEANLGLFYALVETEQIDAATAHIDAYAARLPERRHRDGKYNGERLSADITADQVRIYADRLSLAAQRLDQRQPQIPFNAELRQSTASLALARGWPKLGEQTLRRVLASDPDNPAIHADLAETRLILQDWPAARTSLADAISHDAGHGSVRRARRSAALHDSYELSSEAGFGKGQNSGYLGSRDWSVDSYLYSRPIGESWRIYAHNYSSSADFDGSNTQWIRSGLGAEYRWLDWRITGEATGGSSVKPGLSASLGWKPDDHWTLTAAAESVTQQIPLRAVRDGVQASRVELGADWRAHEARKFSASLASSDFSDGNQRTAVNLAWFERWASGPRWMFETTLGADAGHNTLAEGFSYFNPKNDRSLWLTAAVENLGWRHYDRSFHQRLALTGGRYWQLENDIPAGTIEAIEYGHRWELERDLSLRYSIGRSLRPYDGVREGRNFLSMSLLWRF